MTTLKNCMVPADCECAKRGYQHESDKCLIPRVAEAASALGLAVPGLPRRTRPKPVALNIGGTALPLVITDDFARDVLDAIKTSQSNGICKFTRDEIDRIIRKDKYDKSVIFHTYSEKFGSNKILSWLILIQLREGDCLAWMTVFPHSGIDPVFAATLAERDALFSMLRIAAGSEGEGSGEDHPSHIPSEEEIEWSINNRD
jgi:hypothetical protein